MAVSACKAGELTASTIASCQFTHNTYLSQLLSLDNDSSLFTVYKLQQCILKQRRIHKMMDGATYLICHWSVEQISISEFMWEICAILLVVANRLKTIGFATKCKCQCDRAFSQRTDKVYIATPTFEIILLVAVSPKCPQCLTDGPNLLVNTHSDMTLAWLLEVLKCIFFC